jgi:hypothetical protein
LSMRTVCLRKYVANLNLVGLTSRPC